MQRRHQKVNIKKSHQPSLSGRGGAQEFQPGRQSALARAVRFTIAMQARSNFFTTWTSTLGFSSRSTRASRWNTPSRKSSRVWIWCVRRYLVAQGHSLHGAENQIACAGGRCPAWAAPFNAASPPRIDLGQQVHTGLQGKILTYRSTGGYGVRLDGGMGYAGAVITPFYDSLLVKITAYGREFEMALQRMDRALREKFRIRGASRRISLFWRTSSPIPFSR